VRAKLSLLSASIICLAGLAASVAAAPAQAVPASHEAPAVTIHVTMPRHITRHDRRIGKKIIRWEKRHRGNHAKSRDLKQTRRHAKKHGADPCAVVTNTNGVYEAGFLVAWFTMTTHYCYTGPSVGPWGASNKVTSHRTTFSVGVTGPGEVAGWGYDQSITGIVAHCFKNGYGFHDGVNRCSGEYESDEVEFTATLPILGPVASAYPYIWEAEWMTSS
jgi:hypothetical protein